MAVAEATIVTNLTVSSTITALTTVDTQKLDVVVNNNYMWISNNCRQANAADIADVTREIRNTVVGEREVRVAFGYTGTFTWQLVKLHP